MASRRILCHLRVMAMTPRRTTRQRPEEQEGLQETQAPLNFLQRRPYTIRCRSGTAAKMETPRSKKQIEEWRLESSGVVDD
ncbi:hypothetical protein OsI_15766 [Oryza sativa Indica Group]|uniref:Uncharacterized protein n=1 Tax=Oryza sativa subsp. indica TaxID=39946 RepID=A2XT30_ORYSI|nr:hypothetical protein OsI_15766 [Oryza sativa Indica Group]